MLVCLFALYDCNSGCALCVRRCPLYVHCACDYFAFCAGLGCLICCLLFVVAVPRRCISEEGGVVTDQSQLSKSYLHVYVLWCVLLLRRSPLEVGTY